MELIVAGYVKVITEGPLRLAETTGKVLAEFQALSDGINPANAIRAIQDELAIIGAGLDQLDPATGTLLAKDY